MVGHILQVRDDVSRHVAARLFAVGESPGIFGNGKFKSLGVPLPSSIGSCCHSDPNAAPYQSTMAP